MTLRLVVPLLVLLVSGAAEAGTFFRALPLPIAETPFGRARAISPDGLWVVGDVGTPALWDAAGTLTQLDVPPGKSFAEGWAVSGDGMMVAGNAKGGGIEAFLWTVGGGFTPLGDLTGGIVHSQVGGMTPDGVTVVGTSSGSNGFEAFSWTAQGGMVGLGDLPGGGFESAAWGISSDGGVIVGESLVASGGYEPFRWTAGTGMVGLGYVSGDAIDGAAYAVSSDGTAIVGFNRVDYGSNEEAFRWTDATGMVRLGFPTDPSQDWEDSVALAVSADGSSVVGNLDRGSDVRGVFLWTEAEGMRELDAVLADLGADLTGWTLEDVRGISDDGLTIVGTGLNPQGNTQPWVAYVPEPARSGLLVPCASIFVWLRRVRGA